LSTWTSQRVLDTAAATEAIPEGAIVVQTADYRLVRHPDWVLGQPLGAAQVNWSRTARPLDQVVEEVAARVRYWGLPGVAWWVSAVSRPVGTDRALRDRGAELVDAVHVLACELGDDPPKLDVPADVTVEVVRDERTVRAASAVTVPGWGMTEPDEAEIASALRQAVQDLATWSSFRLVAMVDHEPVSVGGCTMTGEVAQLWGAITLPASRGHGAYRAVLSERLRLAHEHGATLAMVKGRSLPHAPVLLRAGFTDYGEQRCYWLPVA